MSFTQADLLAGQADPKLSEACHAVPFRLVNGLTMLGPALGAARGALAAWTRWIATKTEVSMGTVVHAAERPGVQPAGVADRDPRAVELALDAVPGLLGHVLGY